MAPHCPQQTWSAASLSTLYPHRSHCPPLCVCGPSASPLASCLSFSKLLAQTENLTVLCSQHLPCLIRSALSSPSGNPITNFPGVWEVQRCQANCLRLHCGMPGQYELQNSRHKSLRNHLLRTPQTHTHALPHYLHPTPSHHTHAAFMLVNLGYHPCGPGPQSY